MDNLKCTARTFQLNTEVLEDLISFFDASPEFISIPCQKLRRTQGKTFNMKVINALMSLRNDLEKKEKKTAIQMCEDIILNFKDEPSNADEGSKKKGGMFEKALLDEDGAANKKKGKKGDDKGKGKKQDAAGVSSEDDDDDSQVMGGEAFDMDAFLLEGGL